MDSRKIALEILNELDRGEQTLDAVLEEATANVKFPYKKDRALLQAIVFGVLRWRNRLDWIIQSFSNTPFAKIDPVIRNILRMGLFQILYLERIPVSAAVNTSVEMAKSQEQPWISRFVNAVLRNAATSHESVAYPDAENDPVLNISIEKSFPESLLNRWIDRFGAKETRQLCDAFNQIAPITVRTNSLRTTREKLFKSLQGETRKVWATSFSPVGVGFSTPAKPISELTAFRLGWFQVQDEAAQLASYLLAPRPGDNVLDACAGLGGKTGHIAQMMKNQGRISAMDKNKVKLGLLKAEIDRQYISIVTTQVHDLYTPFKKKFFETFDRIFLDAPCSGLGVLGRNPDAKWRFDPAGINAYRKRQIHFIDNLAPVLKPGGTLVYAVCSTEPEETNEVVENFLKTHAQFELGLPPKDLFEKHPSLFSKEGFFRSFPHIHGMDGFFAAVLVKKK